MSEMINLTIDGRAVQAPKGTLLIKAAAEAGINIPYFCYHPKLEPAGVCRMCLVQIEKIPKPQTACTTMISEGMVVHTQHNNAVAAELQKGVLEFLLLNHPLDCPVCDKGGECDLQDLTFAHGPDISRLQDGKIRKDKAVDLGNFIVLDNERCILCRRCTRFDNEIATEGNLIIEERGHHNQVSTMPGQRYDSYFSGNTIELCPVGALTSEIYRFKARPWDLSKVDAICTGCSVGCSVKQEFRHGQLLRLTSRENPATDDGWLCDRGRFNYRYVHDEKRLTQPLLRRGAHLVPVSWQEALSYVAQRLAEIKSAQGGPALGVIGGGKLTNEEAYLLQKFARMVLGTNHIDHRIDEQVVASLGSFPGRQTDINDAQAILLVDVNPAEVAPVLDLRIRKMVDRKRAKVAVIAPVRPAYRGRFPFIPTVPGETADLLASLTNGLQDAKAAKQGNPALAQVADLLGGSGKLVILWSGQDLRAGRALLDLANAIKAKTGRTVHLLIPGSQHNSRGAEAMGALPHLLPGYSALSDSRARQAIGQAYQSRNLPAEHGLATGEMLSHAVAGQIKGLLLVGANLLNTWPDRKLVQTALDKSFTVSIDLFLNETAQMADVVLPAAALSEKSGSYTTLDGLVQTMRAAKKPEGEAKPDGEILVNLAGLMGTRLSGSPAETQSEIARLFTRLEAGSWLGGTPASLLPEAPAAPQKPTGLVLVPVERLYAGGSTAQFDDGFSQVLPEPVALLHPDDLRQFGLQDGEPVELSTGGAGIRLKVRPDRRVRMGTVQVIKRLSAAPVNLLTRGSAPHAVTLVKLAVGVAD